jgi:hypothetical protein
VKLKAIIKFLIEVLEMASFILDTILELLRTALAARPPNFAVVT